MTDTANPSSANPAPANPAPAAPTPMPPMQFHLFVPQMRLSFDQLVERARVAEEVGFRGMALMDHLAPPLAETQPMYEAMVTATWLAARTERLVIGHLVLCDGFRHPAVLAKEAVSLDHASGGRFELGIGWGSVPAELATFGVLDTAPPARVARLADTLEVLGALWSGEPVEHRGPVFTIAGGVQRPAPLGRIPLVIGGAGRRTMELVARHADWWNVPMHEVHRLDELRPLAGSARVSTQEMVAFVPSARERPEVEAMVARRFGAFSHLHVGDADELVALFRARRAAGVERCYVWFADFAPPDTLRAFAERVMVHC